MNTYRYDRKWVFVSCMTIMLCLLLTVPAGLAQEDGSATDGGGGVFRVAVVRDGHSPYYDSLISDVRKEADVLLEAGEGVSFITNQEYNAAWDRRTLEEIMEKALGDPDVDAIFAAGPRAVEYAADRKMTLSKPVLGGLVQDAGSASRLYDPGTGQSGKTNFNVVVFAPDVGGDLDAFGDMVDYVSLAILLGSGFAENDTFQKHIRDYESEKGVTVSGISLGERPGEVLEALKESDVEAVYLTPSMKMTDAEWQRVIDGCTRLDLPTFSMMGVEDVERGVLAGRAPNSHTRLARQIALNLQQVMSGVPARTLPVTLDIDPGLVINAATAEAIGYAPAIDVMMEARLIDQGSPGRGQPLNMGQAFTLALENNPGYLAKAADVEQVRGQRNQAMSDLFPQVEGSARYQRVREAVAENSMGTQPEYDTTVGVRAKQMIFSDSIISSYRIARRGLEATEEKYDTARLDLLQRTATAYLDFLQAQALRTIAMDNLNLTRSNLEIAEVRHNTGTAGPEEVYRWEVQAASQKADVLDADARVKETRQALNQVLSMNPRKPWNLEHIPVQSNLCSFLGIGLKDVLEDEAGREAFADVVAEQALRNSPELRAFEKTIEAKKLDLGQVRRGFALPEVTAQFDYSDMLDKKMAGETSGVEPEDQRWMASVSASLPLFEGGGRVFELAATRAELMRLQHLQKETRNEILNRAYDVLASLSSTFPGVAYERQAAATAKKNLAVIRDKYSRGVASILDLLDAQNQAFVARQNAAIAVYSYLRDMYRLQRVLGMFEEQMTEEERESWANRLRKHMNHHR